jgi:hypothetical protein
MYGRGPDFDSRSKVLHRHDEVSYARSSPLDPSLGEVKGSMVCQVPPLLRIYKI